MENTNNSAQQRVDQNTGGPLEGMSPQHINLPGNDVNEDTAIYADLGLGGRPDVMNPGDDEATDTILYTDNDVARNMTDVVADSPDLDADIPADYYNDLGNVPTDKLEAEFDEFAASHATDDATAPFTEDEENPDADTGGQNSRA